VAVVPPGHYGLPLFGVSSNSQKGRKISFINISINKRHTRDYKKR
jgi:hypothetical protein